MRDLLFLSHRIPYPPDKGDKIRAWNFLRHLAANYRVHLGFFIDNPDDVAHLGKLKEICASVFWQGLSPHQARLRALRCLLTGQPLTSGYFGDARFAAQVDRVIAQHHPSRFYVYCSAMAPYVARHRAERHVVDMVDVDSEKWRQYAQVGSKLSRIAYSREARLLLELERRAANAADAVVFASRAEAAIFETLAPEAADRTSYINNGVDASYFDPRADIGRIFDERPAIVFTGAMDYFPNVQAVTWFAEEVMPRLRSHPAEPCFWIVGSNPSSRVRRLARPDVRVTGRVPDTRPYLAQARVAVAPLRIARGIQNKVLEAMAMRAAVVVTPEVRAGLDCRDDEVLVADSADEYAAQVSRVLDDQEPTIGARARTRVMNAYSWQASFAAVVRLLEGEPGESGFAGTATDRLVSA